MTNLFNQPQAQNNAPLSEAEKLAWLRLFRSENIGPITFYRLVEYYGGAENALKALPELAKRGGRKKPLVAAKPETIEREYDALLNFGGQIITAACTEYPLALAAIDDAPPVISVIGEPSLMHKSCVGMVGARNASINGKKFAAKLAADLGAQQQVVVSGLARGIDTSAHQGALASGTIAVIAGGLDVIYPEENRGLYEQIKEQGLIIAECPFGQKPFAQSFPKRNRIVAGLSKGVVVVEATMRSGSLITARMSGEQGRDVYAVPGHPMDPRAAGPNHLIREGATLVRSSADIMESLMEFSGSAMREPFAPLISLTPPVDIVTDPPEDAHDAIIDKLSFTPISVDELLRSCHFTIGVLQTVLLDLELAGRIKRLPGNRIQLLGDE